MMLDDLGVLDVRELALVRESIGAVWSRNHEHGRCSELVAINTEVDHLIIDATQRSPNVPPELLQAISHDLRNPLGTITLGATLLETKLLGDDRLMRSVQMIRRSADKLECLLDDVLDVAKLQNGSLELDRQVVRASDLVGSAVEANRQEAAEKRVELVCDADLDGELVSCDRDRISDAIEAVIANAIRTSREGERIEVTGAANGHVRLMINPVHRLGRLDHFVANGVIAAHGGELCFEDSTVTITLPVES